MGTTLSTFLCTGKLYHWYQAASDTSIADVDHNGGGWVLISFSRASVSCLHNYTNQTCATAHALCILNRVKPL